MFPEGVFSPFQDAIKIRSRHRYYYSIRFPYGEEVWCVCVCTVEIAAQWDAIITTRNKIVLLIIYILGRSGTTSRGVRPVPPSRRYVIVCSMAVSTRTAIGRSGEGEEKRPIRIQSLCVCTVVFTWPDADVDVVWTSLPLGPPLHFFSSTYIHTHTQVVFRNIKRAHVQKIPISNCTRQYDKRRVG